MRLKLFIAAWRSWSIWSSLQMYVCFGGSPGVNISNLGRSQWTAHSVHPRRRNIHKSCAVHYHTGGPRVTPILWSNGHQSCIGLAMTYFLISRVKNVHWMYLFFKLSGHQTLKYHYTRSMPILVIVGDSYQRWITNKLFMIITYAIIEHHAIALMFSQTGTSTPERRINNKLIIHLSEI